jgi:hypothetical protein
MAKFKLNSAPSICIFYHAAALVALVVFRFIYPDFEGGDKLLDVFWFRARFARGLLTFIEVFPALFMSSLVLPYAITVYGKSAARRFSTRFFDSFKPQIISCIAGSVIYAVLYLGAAPALERYQQRAQSETRLFDESKKKAERFAAEEKWAQAAVFFALSDHIWPGADQLSGLREKILAGMERLRYGRENRPQKAGQKPPGLLAAPLDAVDALKLAKDALNKERYYDAHWLANAAERLARPQSAEAVEAVRTASLAWNAISRIESSREDEQLFAFYRRKREGYEALLSGEWLRAYYIFNALAKEAPLDPDVRKYFALSEEGLLSITFFIDEMDLAVGDALSNTVFSIPRSEKGGRLVLRLEALTVFDDAAFGRGLEALSFSPQGTLYYRLSSEAVKILPVSVNGEWRTALLLSAVDRDNPAIRLDPVWSGGSGELRPQVLLDMPFEDFLLAAAVQEGTRGFFLQDFWQAAEKLGDNGYVPEVFSVWILRTLMRIAAFPSFAVLGVIIGWKYRAKYKVRYALYPMLVTLPLVFSLLSSLVQSALNTLVIYSVLSLGFSGAFVLMIGSSVLFFALSLFLLSAQRSEAL